MAPALIYNSEKSSSGCPSPTLSAEDSQPKAYNGPEPVAIVGMACRLPGESDSPEDFWQMLVDNRSGYTEPPASRWNADGFHSTKRRPGGLRPRGGYFISEKLFNFDPQFFGITQTEAVVMDPAQRKLLECVYEAFESGGVPLEKVSGTNTAVYVGNFTYDYSIQGLRDGDYPKPYGMTGAGVTILSNRISYVFNLCGPSLTLDTACSSSMYAAHMACRALQTGEVDGAIVGGSNLMMNVDVQMATDSMGVLSATSTCHTFDASADGYGRAESIGALYLKRLSDAVRDGDPIRGVFRATASNANGKTSGITQPSALGQEAVIRSAYKFAGGLNPDQTSYFECHGTGTPVGDPIELNAISKVFLEQSYRESLLIGGVKPNVGHGEAGSAIASLIKVALALEIGTIPATIGIKNYNPNINFREGRLQVVKDNLEWPSKYTVRRASINSFGYGGANSHAIMESSESLLPGYKSFTKRKHILSSPEPVVDDAPEEDLGTIGTNGSTFSIKERTEFLLPFSAADFPTLKSTVSQTREVVESYELSDLAYTLSNHRSSFYNRGYATVSEESAYEDLEDSQMTNGKRGNGTRICFIFTGQGAQSAQMGKELMQSFPTYLKTIRDLDAVLQSLGDDAPSWTIEDSLLEPKATSSIDQVHLSQPLCTAVQIALVNLLQEWGVTPVACVGHSSGEIAAAYAAGTLDAKQAILYAYFRGVSVSDLKQRGTMLAVGLTAEEVQPYLEDGIRIACYNSPESLTLSGDEEVALRVKAKLDDAKIFVRELKTSGRAYHSHHMKSVGGGYEELANAAIDCMGASERRKHEKNARLPTFISSVTGVEKNASFHPDASYWRRNLESPVLFSPALTRALAIEDLGINHLVEIGPHSALAGPIRQLKDHLKLNSRDLDYTPSLVRGASSVTKLLDLAGNLFIKGYPVDLAQVNAVQKVVNGAIVTKPTFTIVDLPRYSWNYANGTNLRSENRISAELRTRKFPRHDLLGSRVLGGIRDQAQWRNQLDAHDLPWLEQHKLGPQAVLPATGYLAIAVEAARQFYDGKVELTTPFRYFLPQIAIKAALRIPQNGAIEVLTSMRFQPVSNNYSSKTWLEFTIQSLHEGRYTDHCVGVIGTKDIEPVSPMIDETKLQEPKASHTWHRGLASIGLNYGPAFSGMNDLRTDPDASELSFLVNLHPDTIPEDDSRYIVHPATMDKCLQAGIIAAHRGSLKNLERSFIPVSFEEVSIWSHAGADIPPPTNELCRGIGSARFTSLRGLTGAFQLFGEDGRPLFEAKQINSIVNAENVSKTLEDRHPHLRVLWKPDVDQLLRGPLPALATRYGVSLSDQERVVLSGWAQNLAAAAKTSAGGSPLADIIRKWIPTQDSSLIEPGSASLDMCSATTHKEFLKLEAIYVSMIHALQADSGAVESQDVSEDASQDVTTTRSSGSFKHTLDVVAHKYPSMDILQAVTDEAHLDDAVPSILEAHSSLKRYRSFTYVSSSDELLETAREKFSESRETTFVNADVFASSEEPQLEGRYDLFILPKASSVSASDEFLENVKRLLKPTGQILIEGTQESIAMESDHEELLDVIAREAQPSIQPQQENFAIWTSALEKFGFRPQVTDATPAGWTILSERVEQDVTSYSKLVLLSRSSAQSSATEAFSQALAERGWELSEAFLSDDDFVVDSTAIYLSIVEFGGSLFNGGLTAKEFSNLQALTGGEVPAVFWVTTGDLLGKKVEPDAAMVMGLGRTLQNENPLITFCTVDLDHNDAAKGASQVIRLLQKFSKERKESDDVDKEYIIKDDVIHVSRFSEDAILDHEYAAMHESKMVEEAYNAETRVRLDIENLGLVSTLHFKEDHRDLSLEPHEAEVEVRAVGLNMKEAATFRGSFNSESLSHEGAGIVINVGSDVTNVKVGDRVCYLSRGMFGNHEKMPAMLMHKIPDSAQFDEIATMPLVFSTAIYGLLHLGRLKKGETVLIHSAVGGVGLAAIQIAQMVGAEIYATVGTDDKREFLKTEYGLDDAHIFNSRNTSFAADIMKATGGRGIDVALNSLVREFLRASWSIMARNGRHVEIGRTDMMDFGSLDLSVFNRSTTFTAFDLGVVIEETPEIASKVMAESMSYYQQGFIKPLNPRHAYPASEVATAFQHFTDGSRMGKVVVTFDSADPAMGKLKVLRKKDGITFKPDGAYLLVGCLGGLGRCLARWMVDRGAKVLTFLGRSGSKDKAAATMVTNLRARGVTVHVVTGDVGVEADVARAVKASGVPILGMVQGAMALEDKLFNKLDLPGWQYPIDPKVKGTWNLHKCLADQPLDFFVMLGSISAMTGAVTQSNYCAGNTFLDFFARYRANLGLPATTVGLSMVLEVGFVSQNLAIEQGISRSGVHGIGESDFLLLMEAAMKQQASGSWLGDPNANRMLASGFDPAILGTSIDIHSFRFWKQPRVGPVLTAIHRNGGDNGKSNSALEASDVLDLVCEKFSSTFMIPIEDIDSEKTLVSYGMDSMIGTALRNWAFSQFGTDIPASDLMGPALTARSLSDMIFAGLLLQRSG